MIINRGYIALDKVGEFLLRKLSIAFLGYYVEGGRCGPSLVETFFTHPILCSCNFVLYGKSCEKKLSGMSKLYIILTERFFTLYMRTKL